MAFSRRHFLLGSAAVWSCGRPKAGRIAAYAFIANEDDRSISVIDLRRFRNIKKIPLEGSPSRIFARPGSRRVYVLTPLEGTLVEIDTVSLAILRRLRVGGTPVEMRAQGDSAALWVLRRDPHGLVRILLDPFQISSTIALPSAPFDFDLSGTVAAISMPDRRAVAIANLETVTLERTPDLGVEPRVIRFRPDGRQILTGNTSARSVTVIDTQSGNVLVNLPVAIQPERFCFKTNGGELFVTGSGRDAVVIVNPYQTQVSETILAGRTPGSMAVSGKQQYLFVANPESGDITVIDIESRNLLAQVPVGEQPGAILVTSDSQYALVVNRKSGDVAVIRISAIANRRKKTDWTAAAPLFTLIPVGAKPVGAAIYAL